MAKLKILAGDIEPSWGSPVSYLFGAITYTPKGAWSAVSIKVPSDIERIEKHDEHSVRALSDMAGWATLGALVAGPIGAIIGGVFGGQRNEVLFAVYLKDGRKFLASTDPKTFAKMQAATFA